MKTTLPLTGEQTRAIEAIARGGDVIAIEALAGTGKTTTLEQAARRLGQHGTYITFNKRNQVEAEGRFPSTFQCRTAHSLAFDAVGYHYRRRLNDRRRPESASIAALLGCNKTELKLAGHTVDGVQLAVMAWHAVERFIKTADGQLTAKHVESPDHLSSLDRRELKKAVLPLAKKAWRDLKKYTGKLPFSHDAYLKLWQLTDPEIPGDVIFFDEAQDADPVMLAVVNRQSAQRVFVGDRFQAIYEWRGAVNAMESVTAQDTSQLTESFRFGPAIAAEANRYLSLLGSRHSLKGRGSPQSRVGPVTRPDVVLSRTNATAIRGIEDALDASLAPALVGGTQDLIEFAHSAARLQGGGVAQHGWLRPYRRWGDVLAHVSSGEHATGEFATMVRLVEERGPKRLLYVLRRCVNEKQADRVFSTAHKSKGREWDSVRIASDFETGKPAPEELRLLYVALTRAKRELDCSALPTPPRAAGRSDRRGDRRQSNKDLAAQVRALGLSPSGQTWSIAKELQRAGHPISKASIEAAKRAM